MERSGDKMSRARIGAAQAVESLPEWRVVEGRDAIVRNFQFADFRAAFGFMAMAALEAERLDHHPEWANVYGRVDVVLSTHSTGGVSALDVALARRMDEIAARLGG